MVGGELTWIDSVCSAVGPIPLAAVTTTLEVPATVGVPWMSAAPFFWSIKVSPAGSGPSSVMEAMGPAVAVTATDPAWPWLKYAIAPLVMVGGPDAATVIVRASVALLPEELVAEMVT